jgi:hypothetical protein
MRKLLVFFTGLMLLLGTNVLGQQTQGIQKNVSYKTSTYKTFKIPCDKEIDSLSPLDFVYLQAKPEIIRQMQFIIENNKLTIIHTSPHLPRYERDYEFQMGKSVTDAWGTTLYYHNGEEYYNLPNEEENEEFTIEPEAIGTYGFFNGLFDVSIPEIQAFCDSADIPYYIWGQKVLIIYQEDDSNGYTKRTEIETDFGQLYFESRVYRDNIHILTDRTEYQQVDDLIIPFKKIQVHYSELPSETRYQITQVETYLSYKVVNENGDVLVNIGNNDPPFAISVTPNPATDNITVHFSTQIDEFVNIKIVDMMNNSIIVWEQMPHIIGNEINIDISLLMPNLYTVFCTYNNENAEANFLKEGIGQYLVPVNIDMQVVPNPIQNNFVVVFSEQVDAVMNVKIIDIMGTKHLDVSKYVQGNILQINNINHLPASIYYIFCANSEWTGYTQFLKQ